MLSFSNWRIVNTFFWLCLIWLLNWRDFFHWTKDLLTPIMHEGICICIVVILNPSIKSQGLPSKIWLTFNGKTSHHTDSSKFLPKKNVTKQRKLTKMKVSLTHATQNGFRCLSLLRFSLSTSSCKVMFKLLPLSIIMIHNLPWQEICVWKMLVRHQSSSLHLWYSYQRSHCKTMAFHHTIIIIFHWHNSIKKSCWIYFPYNSTTSRQTLFVASSSCSKILSHLWFPLKKLPCSSRGLWDDCSNWWLVISSSIRPFFFTLF